MPSLTDTTKLPTSHLRGRIFTFPKCSPFIGSVQARYISKDMSNKSCLEQFLKYRDGRSTKGGRGVAKNDSNVTDSTDFYRPHLPFLVLNRMDISILLNGIAKISFIANERF